VTALGSTGLGEDGPLLTPGSADESHLSTGSPVEENMSVDPLDHDGEYSFVDPLVHGGKYSSDDPSVQDGEYSSGDHLVDELSEEDLSLEPLVHDRE